MVCLLYSTIISITFLVSGIKQKLDEEKNKLVDDYGTPPAQEHKVQIMKTLTYNNSNS